jgi:hypothetical protein
MLGDAAYDSAELREELDEHGTKPVFPNRCNRKLLFSFGSVQPRSAISQVSCRSCHTLGSY